MAGTPHDDFPLATALTARLSDDVDVLAAGGRPSLFDELTPTTVELLRHWFEPDQCDLRQVNFHPGQREAIFHLIYAHEVLHPHRLLDLYEQLAPDALLRSGALGTIANPRNDHPKYAAKMATGTGKTWVLNALIVWSYLNHVEAPDDPRFTKNFLVIAPGLIVYDRLLDSFLGKEIDGDRDYSTADLYTFRSLFLPEHHRERVFSFVQTSVTRKDEIGNKVTSGGMIGLTNWHLLAGEEDDTFLDADDEPATAAGEDVDAAAAVKSFIPLTPGTSAGNALDGLDRRYLRGGPLDSLVQLPDLMVFNDEAHHVHELRKGGETTEVEWQRTLDRIAETKDARFVQVDFSATPYNTVGSGKKATKEWFPHIVVDYDLIAAMRAGLVKSIALDRRKELAALPLDFNAERDERGKAVGLSNGQRVMLRAGLTKLRILEAQFAKIDPAKHPKMLVLCEDTSVTGFVSEFLAGEGLDEDGVLTIDSKTKGELKPAQWNEVRERLFDVDAHADPKVIVSVLMLREGFDVNNICVIVPLRASNAPILLEQTIGRGLRLMWRGNPEIDEMKDETRQRIRKRLEPDNYFDVLFIVEHPAFVEFYEDLLSEGLISEDTGEAEERQNVTGDLITVGLREGFEEFDFKIPVILRDVDEELVEPSIDPMALSPGRHAGVAGGVSWLKGLLGKGDTFVSEDAQTGTRYGDYSVDGGVLTATGYGDYLGRITNRLATALSGRTTKNAQKYKQMVHYPMLQAFRPLLTGWIDIYIRGRLFDEPFDPMADENWRVLLLPDVVDDISAAFAAALIDATNNTELGGAQVLYRPISEVASIKVRTSSSVVVSRSIYPRLPYPARSGGLERRFIEWAEVDTSIEAFVKVDEYHHHMVHRPYLKADGMPAYYSPDFLVRTAEAIFIVETKAQGALSDENVVRKKRAARSWVDQINRLDPEQRADREWSYVLLGESTVESWKSNGEGCSALLEYARLTPETAPQQQLELG